MCKANLLIHLESFAWDNLTICRTKELNDLALVSHGINRKEHVIYSHPDTYMIKLSWGYLYEILTFDEETKKRDCPWLSHDHQKILIKLFSHSITNRPSYNIDDLDKEFVNGVNGMLGIDSKIIDRYVCNENTLAALCAFYAKPKIVQPVLTISGNEINRLIERSQTHPLFMRLDLPKQIEDGKMLHGEQVQMHFNDRNKSCLNIDGTWKHGFCFIPGDAKEILRGWGFLIQNE